MNRIALILALFVAWSGMQGTCLENFDYFSPEALRLESGHGYSESGNLAASDCGECASHDDEHSEECPPSCHCLCCTTVVLQPNLNVEGSRQVAFQSEKTSIHSFHSSDFQNAVWQPPRHC